MQEDGVCFGTVVVGTVVVVFVVGLRAGTVVRGARSWTVGAIIAKDEIVAGRSAARRREVGTDQWNIDIIRDTS